MVMRIARAPPLRDRNGRAIPIIVASLIYYQCLRGLIVIKDHLVMLQFDIQWIFAHVLLKLSLVIIPGRVANPPAIGAVAVRRVI